MIKHWQTWMGTGVAAAALLMGVAAADLRAEDAPASGPALTFDFEQLQPGPLRTQDNRFVPVSGAEEAVVAQGAGADGKPTNVLSHKSSGGTIITRTADDLIAPLSGEVLAVCDVRPVSGDHVVVWWEDTAHYSNMGSFVNFTYSGKLPVILAQGEPGRKVADYEPGKWYRVTTTMHIDSGDGTKSTYDVLVQELQSDGAVGKTVGSVQKINCLGAPTYIRAGQLQSIVPKGGQTEGEFDNWSIGPASK